tara:strand:- start:292 stop:555 length:264 start_codon:yes stop_codon:yes gene_type:complete
MFVGSTYIIHDLERTVLGYATIEIRERVLSRTRQNTLLANTVTTEYFYTLLCFVDGDGTAEIDEGELLAEVSLGYYEYAGRSQPRLL